VELYLQVVIAWELAQFVVGTLLMIPVETASVVVQKIVLLQLILLPLTQQAHLLVSVQDVKLVIMFVQANLMLIIVVILADMEAKTVLVLPVTLDKPNVMVYIK